MKSYFLYDGECGVCTHAVSFLLHFSKSNELYFSSLNSEFSKITKGSSYCYDQEDEGAVYIRGEAVYHKSTAILQALSECRWPFSMAKIFLLLPQGLRNWFYKGFAKRRLNYLSNSILNANCPRVPILKVFFNL